VLRWLKLLLTVLLRAWSVMRPFGALIVARVESRWGAVLLRGGVPGVAGSLLWFYIRSHFVKVRQNQDMCAEYKS